MSAGTICANLRVVLLSAILGLIALSFAPSQAQAQFSETWEFYKAMEKGDYREMMSRLNKGANINRPRDDQPAIVMAADKSDQHLLGFLIDNGANVNGATIERQETALMRRAGAGDVETVRFLLDRGADPNAQDRSGETALIRAARGHKRKVVQLLLDSGADVDRADYTGKTALDYARDARARNIVRALEEAGAR